MIDRDRLVSEKSEVGSPWYRRDPLPALREEIDRLLSRFSTGVGELGRVQMPALDLSETDSTLEIRADLPGMKSEDVDIEVSGTTLTIRGERTEETEKSEKNWHLVERQSGSFSRTITLPCEVQIDQASAEFHDGVLTITLPKSEQTRTRKIQIKA